MAGVQLDEHQIKAVRNMKNGCILCGGVGSGKSRTALAYYYLLNGGKLNTKDCTRMIDPKDLYIITTARKRDQLEWEEELLPFLLYSKEEGNSYDNVVKVDSWNNIAKYKDVTNAFFIFDEQRVVGSGTWVKAFTKIAKNNQWVLLSATPGDTWADYIPVFVANGFYKNRTEFLRRHAVYSRFTKFPKIEKFIETKRLECLKASLLVNIEFERKTEAININVTVDYDVTKYKEIGKKRWDPYKDEPIVNAGALCYIWRKVVNSDLSRQLAVLEVLDRHPRVIIFYNFDYELEILKGLLEPLTTVTDNFKYAEWNGHKHENIPNTSKWVYLVQYTAGCEGWNCITTDTILFYSQNYSYKVMVQAAGRVDRRNTPYTKLYYYHLRSKAPIDLGIGRALHAKKKFNEKKFAKF